MTSNARASNRILGSLRSADGKGIVRMEDRYDTDIDDLWAALTDPKRLARWIGDVEGDLRPGGEYRTHFFASGAKSMGRVEVCEPPQRLLLRTKHVDQPFELVIEATLTADGEQTILVVEERGMPLDLLTVTGRGSKSTSNISPTTLPGSSPARSTRATSRRAGASSSRPTKPWRRTSEIRSERTGAAGRLRELLRQQPSWGRATQGRLPWRRRVSGCARRVSSLRV